MGRTWMLGCAGTSLEGVVAKRLNRPYGPGQCGWQRLRTRITTEAVAGGITGPLEAPQELIVGRHGEIGRLRVVGRTIPLRSPCAARWPEHLPGTAAARLRPPTPSVRPNLVVEVSAALALDGLRWRRPVRFVRARDDLQAGGLASRVLQAAASIGSAGRLRSAAGPLEALPAGSYYPARRVLTAATTTALGAGYPQI